MKTAIQVLLIILLPVCFVWGQEDYCSEYIGDLVYVPEGSFQRSDNPEHISSVSAFRISRYQISRDQFSEVSGLKDNSFFKRIPDAPAENLNWFTAVAFCNYLSILEGLEPVYSIEGKSDPSEWTKRNHPQSRSSARSEVTAKWEAEGYRLPTEMEWMWAAMGADSDAPGEINRTGYLKAFAGDRYGKDWKEYVDDYAWYRSNSKVGNERHMSPQPRGSKKPNELGLFDMSGNVMEWCWDYRGGSWEYPGGHLSNYRGAEDGGRIIRGGSWDRPTRDLSISRRTAASPGSNYNWVGFRVVRP
jgi:formylglycine-generating enzyme required for sulfatase activity